MDEIMDVAKRHNIKVIEDCAQSYMTYYKGNLCGTIGDIGCFSINNSKHISAGEGGMCIMNDKKLYGTALLFADKNYVRTDDGDFDRNIPYIAPNYRMSELVGAVGLAQLERLPWICERRRAYGEALAESIKKIDGLHPHEVREGNVASYWFYLMRVDSEVMGVDAETFAAALRAEGVGCAKGYLPYGVYEYDLFKNKSAYKGTHAPFDSKYYGKDISYHTGLCPVAEEVLENTVRININEFFSEDDLKETIAAVEKVAKHFYAEAKNKN